MTPGFASDVMRAGPHVALVERGGWEVEDEASKHGAKGAGEITFSREAATDQQQPHPADTILLLCSIMSSRREAAVSSSPSDARSAQATLDPASFTFGSYTIHPSTVFAVTTMSFAFVNLRPVVRHILPSHEITL